MAWLKTRLIQRTLTTVNMLTWHMSLNYCWCFILFIQGGGCGEERVWSHQRRRFEWSNPLNRWSRGEMCDWNTWSSVRRGTRSQPSTRYVNLYRYINTCLRSLVSKTRLVMCMTVVLINVLTSCPDPVLVRDAISQGYWCICVVRWGRHDLFWSISVYKEKTVVCNAALTWMEVRECQTSTQSCAQC